MSDTRVLLIDDDPRERQALVRYLRIEAEFETTSCANGREALAQLKSASQDYTAVLLDYVLKAEEMPGRQVLQQIRERHPYLPVIVFTGLDPEKGVQALSEGAYRYLRKPLDHVELVNIVNSLAEQEAIFRRMAQDLRQMMGSDMCLVWRLDRQARHLRIVAWDGDRDLDTEYLRSTFLDLTKPPTEQVFENRQPIFLSDVTDPELAPYYQHRDYARRQGWISLISIPLVRQARIIGQLDSYTHTKLLDAQQRDQWLQVILPPFARQAAEAAWNAELSDRFQALQGLNDVLAGTFEEETILQQILAKGIELVGANAGWVYRLDVNRGKLILKESFGVEKDRIGEERELGAGISGHVARIGQALNISDVTRPSLDYQYLEIPGLEVKSEVTVPLRRGEQSIGALTVTSPLPNSFSNEDVSLLSSLAAQAAVAIGRADVTRHSLALGRLALGGDFDRLAEYVVGAARDLTGADVILWMMSDETDIEIAKEEKEKEPCLRVKTSRGDINAGYLGTARTPTNPGSSITALALARREPVVRRDIQDELEAPGEPRFYNSQAAAQHSWHGFMAVPLLECGEAPVGSLNLYGKEVAKFGESDAGLMHVFADQIAIAMENARLIRELEDRVTELDKLRELSEELSAGIWLGEI